MVERRVSGDWEVEQVFRHCHEEHADLWRTLEASRGVEGRFHVRGEFGAIYVAADRETALAELDHRAKSLGLHREDLLPRLLLALEISVRRTLDLTDADEREAWGLTLDDLWSNDYRRCQEVATAARADGFEAIRFPSARGAGENYAIFFDRLVPGSYLREEGREVI